MDKAHTESCTSAGNDITTVEGWYWPTEENEYSAEEEHVVILGTLQPECFDVNISDDYLSERKVKILGIDDMTIEQTKKLFGGY